jgi:hypothetical protein
LSHLKTLFFKVDEFEDFLLRSSYPALSISSNYVINVPKTINNPLKKCKSLKPSSFIRDDDDLFEDIDEPIEDNDLKHRYTSIEIVIKLNIILIRK